MHELIDTALWRLALLRVDVNTCFVQRKCPQSYLLSTFIATSFFSLEAGSVLREMAGNLAPIAGVMANVAGRPNWWETKQSRPNDRGAKRGERSSKGSEPERKVERRALTETARLRWQLMRLGPQQQPQLAVTRAWASLRSTFCPGRLMRSRVGLLGLAPPPPLPRDGVLFLCHRKIHLQGF